MSAAGVLNHLEMPATAEGWRQEQAAPHGKNPNLLETRTSAAPRLTISPWLKGTLSSLAIVAAAASGFAWEMARAERQRVAVEEIIGLGGSVYYGYCDSASDSRGPDARSLMPRCVQQYTSPHFLVFANEVMLPLANLQDEDLRHLAGLPGLEKLTLITGNVTDAGLGYLEHLHNLQELMLSYTGVTGQGMASIARLHNLRSLCLRRTQVDDAGLTHLAALGKLEYLNLAGTPITDAGVIQLTRLPLNRLQLQNTAISDRSVPLFATMQSLEYLDLSGTRISDAGFARLCQLLPGAKVYR